MTEYEEITLKKLIKGKMVDVFYVNVNVLMGQNHIANNELSEKIGWDAAGYNQKLTRQSDLRVSTLINLFVAITELINEKHDTGLSFYERYEEMDFHQLFSMDLFRLGELFLHVSAAAEGHELFLNSQEKIRTYKSLRTYVYRRHQALQISDEEKDVYMKYYNTAL